VVHFIDQLTPGDTSCAASNEFVWPATGRFPKTALDAKKAKTDHGDGHRPNRSNRTARGVATVAVATMMDAFKRSFYGSQGGMGLRGGAWSIGFSDVAA